MVDDTRMVAVVTGASSGIGFHTALGLARDGWHVIALGRNEERMARSARAIAEDAPAARVDWIRGDLSLMANVREAGVRIGERTGRIDVLVNNAGQVLGTHNVTAEGLEQTFAGNVLAPFLLTGLLLPQLQAARRPHVITTSSVGHSFIDDMFWDDLQMTQAYNSTAAYLQSKLGNVLFTRELARRHPEITSSAVHPGAVDSNFTETGEQHTKDWYAKARERGEVITAVEGADTLLWLARDIDHAGPSGGYFAERQRVEPSPGATNPASATRLWHICEDLTGIAY